MPEVVRDLRLSQGVGREVVHLEHAQRRRLARVRVRVLQPQLDGPNLCMAGAGGGKWGWEVQKWKMLNLIFGGDLGLAGIIF